MASIESDYDVLLKRRLEKIEQLKTTTIDYVKITKSFSDALKPLLDMQKKQDKSAKEQIKNQKTLIAQNAEEVIGLTELQDRLISVNQVTKDMQKTTLENISSSKAWTAASRILSGSGLWRIQNRVRAVVDVFAILEKRKLEDISRTKEQSKVLRDFSELQDEQIRIHKLYEKTQQSVTKGEKWSAMVLDNKLKKNFESYALNRKLGIQHEDAVKLLEKELITTKELIKSQEKKIMGSEIGREIGAKKVSIRHAFEEGDMGEWFKLQKELKVLQARRWKQLLTFEKTREKLSKWFKKNDKMIGRKVAIIALKSLMILGVILGTLIAITGLIALFKEFKDGFGWIWSGFAYLIEGGIWLIKDGLSRITGGFEGIVKGLFEGDIWKVLKGFGSILLGIGEVLWGVIYTVIVGFIGGIFTLLTGVFADIWLKGENWLANIMGTIAIILTIITAVAIAVAVIPLLPGLLAIAVGAAIIGVAALIITQIGKWVKKIPGFADGGVSTGGLAVVGERGPELVNLPSGARVHSNSDSRKMVGGSSVTNNITVNVQGRIGASDAEVRDMAAKIGKMIGLEMNRKTSIGRL